MTVCDGGFWSVHSEADAGVFRKIVGRSTAGVGGATTEEAQDVEARSVDGGLEKGAVFALTKDAADADNENGGNGGRGCVASRPSGPCLSSVPLTPIVNFIAISADAR